MRSVIHHRRGLEKFSLVAAAVGLVGLTSTAGAVTYSTDFENPPFATGSINGQDGWMVQNPAFNQQVVTGSVGAGTTHSGTQSWLVANTFGSGTFGDQPYSAPLPGGVKAGESSSVGTTSGYNNDTYSVWFRAADTTGPDGGFISLSLSDASGDRMNYVGIDNSGANGLQLETFDTTSNGFGQPANFNEHDLGGPIDRTQWHQLTVTTTFNDGPSNDTVQYFIDGTPEGTFGTWEDYYRNDPEQAPGGNVVSASDRVLFKLGDTDPTAQGFYFDDFSETAVPEPASLGLLGLSGVALLRRRRKMKC
jgi:hypothetical protein